MKLWVIGLIALYGIIGALAGLRGVAILVLVSLAGLVVIIGAEKLHEWRQNRASLRRIRDRLRDSVR